KMINSKKKGARGEREFRDVLNKYFPESSRRGQQYCGANGDADVICEALPDYHFEVKRTETVLYKKWLEQADKDCKEKTPIVVHKFNNGKWKAIIDAERLLLLLQDTRDNKNITLSESELALRKEIHTEQMLKEKIVSNDELRKEFHITREALDRALEWNKNSALNRLKERDDYLRKLAC
ncbi:hypothetical protein EBU24_03225, partial [bacterium]|nr:hypothetical protein [bacterium]